MPIYLGTGTTNKKLSKLFIAPPSTSNNKAVKEVYIGTSSGNKLVYRNNLMLLNGLDICSSVTGGYTLCKSPNNDYSQGSWTADSSFNGYKLTTSRTPGTSENFASSAATTNKAIDISKYKSLHVNFSDSNAFNDSNWLNLKIALSSSTTCHIRSRGDGSTGIDMSYSNIHKKTDGSYASWPIKSSTNHFIINISNLKLENNAEKSTHISIIVSCNIHNTRYANVTKMWLE